MSGVADGGGRRRNDTRPPGVAAWRSVIPAARMEVGVPSGASGRSGLRRCGLDSAGWLRVVGNSGELRREWKVGDEGKWGWDRGRTWGRGRFSWFLQIGLNWILHFEVESTAVQSNLLTEPAVAVFPEFVASTAVPPSRPVQAPDYWSPQILPSSNGRRRDLPRELLYFNTAPLVRGAPRVGMWGEDVEKVRWGPGSRNHFFFLLVSDMQ